MEEAYVFAQSGELMEFTLQLDKGRKGNTPFLIPGSNVREVSPGESTFCQYPESS